MVDIKKFIDSNPGLINIGASDFDSAIEAKVIPIVNNVVALSALVAVIMIIVSGYLFITAAGNPEKIAKGQQGLTAAIVGMAIVFLARALVVFILGFLG